MRTTSSQIDRPTLSYGDNSMRKFWKSSWPVRIGVAVSLISLTACKTTAAIQPIESSSYTERHPIVVVDDVVAMKVHGASGGRGLSYVQRNRIQTFVANFKESGSETLKIKSPSSVANDVAAAGAVAEVRRIIERNAIPRSNIRMVNYRPRNRRGSSAVILSYRRYQAVASECGTWPDSASKTSENKPVWSFGCASQNNLAAMVANPKDLIMPRNSAPADAQRRDKVFELYRAGEVTTAVRSDAETGTVSSVAQ